MEEIREYYEAFPRDINCLVKHQLRFSNKTFEGKVIDVFQLYLPNFENLDFYSKVYIKRYKQNISPEIIKNKLIQKYFRTLFPEELQQINKIRHVFQGYEKIINEKSGSIKEIAEIRLILSDYFIFLNTGVRNDIYRVYLNKDLRERFKSPLDKLNFLVTNAINIHLSYVTNKADHQEILRLKSRFLETLYKYDLQKIIIILGKYCLFNLTNNNYKLTNPIPNLSITYKNVRNKNTGTDNTVLIHNDKNYYNIINTLLKSNLILTNVVKAFDCVPPDFNIIKIYDNVFYFIIDQNVDPLFTLTESKVLEVLNFLKNIKNYGISLNNFSINNFRYLKDNLIYLDYSKATFDITSRKDYINFYNEIQYNSEIDDDIKNEIKQNITVFSI